MILNPWFQLVASVIAMIMIANLQYAWTLFVGPLQQAHGWKLADIQWAFTLFVLFQTWVQPLDGWFIDRVGPRVFITVAGILCGVGWTAMGSVSTLPQLYFFYVLAGIGAAFVYSGCVGSAVKWFPNRRGLAAGIIAAGFGGGTALFIPIITYLINTRTYRGAFVFTGILQGIVIMIAAQFLRHPGRDFIAVKPTPSAKTHARRNTEQFTTGEMLNTPHFYLLYVMFVAMATGGLVVTANAGPLVRSWGLAAAALTAATALSPIANGASRIFWGWLSDRTGREIAMTIAFLLQALSLFAVLTLGRTSATMFTVTLVLTFFTWGEVFSLFPATIGDYFGSKYATSNYGILYSAKGLSAIIGGGVAAMIYEKFNSWDSVFYGSASLALFSAILAVYLRAQPLPVKKTYIGLIGLVRAASIVGGFSIGAQVAFLLRPSMPLIGQLPASTVISRGMDLQGVDRLVLLPLAQTSFNYILAGATIGVVAGLLIQFFWISRLKEKAITEHSELVGP